MENCVLPQDTVTFLCMYVNVDWIVALLYSHEFEHWIVQSLLISDKPSIYSTWSVSHWFCSKLHTNCLY